MRIDGSGTQSSATWLLGRRRHRRLTIFRALLLSVVVFTLSTVTGVLLSGALPGTPAGVPEDAATDPARHSAYEAAFAQSMVYSGTAALTLSVTGLVMIGRRRRYW
ncbi:MAG TPA: hypothetical protein VIL37_19230 [Natronosporangium sp.]